jgi:hypothetical protein
MEKGTIPKIFDYYFGKAQFKEEILRALREFFNKPDLKAGGKLETREEDEALFNEWFIFDFKLGNGKTPLEDFYEKNPYNLNMVRLQTYKDLQDNHFGFYKVKDIRLGEGLTLENLQTGKVYQVREFAATFGLKKEQVFSARVGRVGDHYELVGSNPSFGPVKFDKTLEDLFRKEKKELTPKTLRDSFLKKEGKAPQKPMEDFPSQEEAEANFRRVLTKYNLDQFVTVATVKEWIYNHSHDEPFNFELNMLCSLLYPDMRDYGNALTEILNSFNVFYNLCPQKELGGKSPFEKSEEQEEKGIPPDLRMSLSKFSPSSWGKKYSKALQHMKQAEFKKALKKFNEILVYLLEHKITYPEIYRLYANKGVCHLALNEAAIGEFMLKISAELNPLYDFAKQQLKKYKKERFVRTRKEQDITCDIGYQYYQFLKPLKINFAHIPKDPSSIVDIKR